MSRPRLFAPARSAGGFTLLEVMVVVVILGVLATITVTALASRAAKAKVEICKTKLKGVEEAIELYKLDYGKYPDKMEDLSNPPAKKNGEKPDSYLRGAETPTDPWGNDFKYAKPGAGGKPFEVRSLGADGNEGGSGEDGDLVNWDVK
ncbi:MAG: type II secretion system major pseudopilin GspG [Planctomycetes bacterium]|nr:type II secretion system major pseudopilin GspG [Planctomycetota bacterium]